MSRISGLAVVGRSAGEDSEMSDLLRDLYGVDITREQLMPEYLQGNLDLGGFGASDAAVATPGPLALPLSAGTAVEGGGSAAAAAAAAPPFSAAGLHSAVRPGVAGAMQAGGGTAMTAAAFGVPIFEIPARGQTLTPDAALEVALPPLLRVTGHLPQPLLTPDARPRQRPAAVATGTFPLCRMDTLLLAFSLPPPPLVPQPGGAEARQQFIDQQQQRQLQLYEALQEPFGLPPLPPPEQAPPPTPPTPAQQQQQQPQAAEYQRFSSLADPALLAASGLRKRLHLQDEGGDDEEMEKDRDDGRGHGGAAGAAAVMPSVAAMEPQAEAVRVMDLAAGQQDGDGGFEAHDPWVGMLGGGAAAFTDDDHDDVDEIDMEGGGGAATAAAIAGEATITVLDWMLCKREVSVPTAVVSSLFSPEEIERVLDGSQEVPFTLIDAPRRRQEVGA